MQVPELNLNDIKDALGKTKPLPAKVEESKPAPKPPDGILKIPKKGSDKLIIKMSEDGVKVKFEERSRGRMKFQIKFSSEEAIAFRNYSQTFKADDMHVDDFIKFIFFTGMTAYSERVSEAVQNIANDPEAMLAAGMTQEDIDKAKN